MKLACCIFAVVASLSCYSQIQTNQLEVANHLIRTIMSSPEWNDNVKSGISVGGGDLPFQEYEDLFQVKFLTNCTGSTWTPSERKLAFENFIDEIQTLSTNGMYRAIETHGGIALAYCQTHGVSNVLDSALNIIKAQRSAAKSEALSCFEEFSRPTSEINDFVLQIVTNKTTETAQDRMYLVGAYANVLLRHRDDADPSCITNGLSVLKAGVQGWIGTIPLDRLCLEMYSGYAESSNRLDLALKALSSEVPSMKWWDYKSSIHEYFTPVTNRLMNAAQPLQEVEALREL